MSHIDYIWSDSKPLKADIYNTRRGDSRYQTLRYWNGEGWWEIAWSNSRGGKPFTWPKGSRTRKPPRAIWDRSPEQLYLRKISAHLSNIQWGEPIRVYDDKEVLAHLVKTGRLAADWRTAYQAEMRSAK